MNRLWVRLTLAFVAVTLVRRVYRKNRFTGEP
jgi:hypothetical protein